MRPATALTHSILLVVTLSSGCAPTLNHNHSSRDCAQRGQAYSARAEKLKRDAAAVLKVGTKKDVVIQFFHDNSIPPTVLDNEITGTIFLKGCAPSGCGTDDALLSLRVEVDKEGTVASKPAIGAMYTSCL